MHGNKRIFFGLLALVSLALAVPHIADAKGGSFSSVGGRSFSSSSSRSFSSSPSRSFSTPSVSKPSSNSFYNSSTPKVTTPQATTSKSFSTPTTKTTPSSALNTASPRNNSTYNGSSRSVEHHYYGSPGFGSGGSFWFWMWAFDRPHGGYQQPMYTNGSVVAGSPVVVAGPGPGQQFLVILCNVLLFGTLTWLIVWAIVAYRRGYWWG